MSEPVLVAEGLCKAYDGVERITVLDELDLSVDAGDSVAVAGVSGVGKSTLLHLLGGLDRPDAGLVRFHGESLGGFDAARLAAYRNRHVGFVFQFHHLLPEFTALENVMVPLRIGGTEREGADRARFLLDRLGLGSRLQHRPSQLSGGEQQRVAVARALAVEPTLVLADEPTGNLDPATGVRDPAGAPGRAALCPGPGDPQRDSGPNLRPGDADAGGKAGNDGRKRGPGLL